MRSEQHATEDAAFELVTEPQADRAVVHVSGELDIATAPDFETAVREQLAQGPVVLDLSGLDFMDSSGVRALDAVLREDGSLVLRPELTELVRQVLDITGLLGELPFEENRT